MPVFTIGSAVELRDIEIFLTLAEELHFGRTAQRLHISTARVSQAIRLQERRLGAKLFERTSRRVELTPLGERLREELSVGYRTIQGAIDFATATGRGIGGLLRVGYTAAWCGTTLIAAADRFTARYPGGEVQIREVQVGDYRQLRAREIELQMSEFPIEEPDLITGPVVFAEPRALVISSNHPVAQQKSLTMEDLAGIQLIDGIGPSQAINSFHFPTHTLRRTDPARPGGGHVARGSHAHQRGQRCLPLLCSRRRLLPAPRTELHPLRRCSTDRVRPGLACRRPCRPDTSLRRHSARRPDCLSGEWQVRSNVSSRHRHGARRLRRSIHPCMELGRRLPFNETPGPR